MQRANWAKWCWDNRSTAQLSCWYYQLTIYPVSTSWEPRRQQYEDKCMQSPVQLTDSPASRWQSQSCFQYCTVMSAVEQFWQTMKLLSFHEVTSIHKLAGSVHVTWRPVVRSNRAQQTPDHLATASSCVSRQTAEAGDMDVFRICHADRTYCRSVESEIITFTVNHCHFPVFVKTSHQLFLKISHNSLNHLLSP